ncbi:pentraxin-related protein PTX3-like [Acipenser oxyrinchus oxyrinchus]|uniref:Pentraxin-related protein PTX3 n=1 Tax=Acipenser oxyrinchus oxyrinchus TaxID=40147 RepID=A0AAD8DEZ1_ACIOX|nr:pentraxin-related protein PTX3-like [Acipenser oxyrinchus oxyrinchus]
MTMLQILVGVFLCLSSVVLGQYDDGFLQVDYENLSYNDISDPEEATPTPCKSTELTKWDKLFSMLENSQMRENILLQYVDEIIKVELQSIRDEMHQFVANFAGTCTNAIDSASTRITSQLEGKLMQIAERIGDTNTVHQSQHYKVLEQLLVASQDTAYRLSKIESAWQNGAEAQGLHSKFKQQDVSVYTGLEKVMDSMAYDLQKTRAELQLSQKWVAQHFLPSGCEVALLFPMRSRKIFASVNPAASMTLDSFTACIWSKVTDALNKTVLFSYGTKRNPYEIQLSLSQQSAVLSVGGDTYSTVAANAATVGEWAHFCGTWSSNEGNASLWVNGELAATSTGVAEGHPIPDGGILQLGQEKNGCCVGGFDEKLAFSGKLTGFNIWDKVLDGEQIAHLAKGEGSCSTRGNVVGWGVTEILPHGGAQYIH